MVKVDTKSFKMLQIEESIAILAWWLVTLSFNLSIWGGWVGGESMLRITFSAYVTDLSRRAWNTQVYKSWQKSYHEKNIPILHSSS